MSVLSRISTALRATPAAMRLRRAQGRISDMGTHRRAALAWLLEAQRAAGGGGFAHSFHLAHGWQPPYPETTGYILPTLRRAMAAEPALAPALEASLRAAAAWLADVQHEDGAVPDVGGQKQVFDTGQVLIGWNDLLAHRPDLARPERVALTARWLASAQAADGSFRRHAWLERPHSYYSRVGAAMAEAGRLLGEPALVAAGRANLDWTLSRQRADTFFEDLSFSGEPPFLHTICYVAEGLLDGTAATGEARYAEAAQRFCLALLDAAGEGPPCSQYAPGFVPANPREHCLTGLAQWAGLCRRLAGLDPRFAASRARAMEVLLRCQPQGSGDPALDGAVPGSEPVWGTYLRLALPNWSVKFLLDALLEDA